MFNLKGSSVSRTNIYHKIAELLTIVILDFQQVQNLLGKQICIHYKALWEVLLSSPQRNLVPGYWYNV